MAVTRWRPLWAVVDRVTISVDVRERRSGVPALLARSGLQVELATLAVGDYAVGDCVVERKTVHDLHRSLEDGRLWSQVAALRRDPRRAYLMVEGAALDAGSVPARAVRGALLKVTDNGIRILSTTSTTDTALWLLVLAGQERRRLDRSERARLGRRPTVVSPVGLLAAIPGIGLEQAKALIAEFGSIAALAQAPESDLRSIPGMGPARARALTDALTTATPRTASNTANAPSSVSPAQAGKTSR